MFWALSQTGMTVCVFFVFVKKRTIPGLTRLFFFLMIRGFDEGEYRDLCHRFRHSLRSAGMTVCVCFFFVKERMIPGFLRLSFLCHPGFAEGKYRDLEYSLLSVIPVFCVSKKTGIQAHGQSRGQVTQ